MSALAETNLSISSTASKDFSNDLIYTGITPTTAMTDVIVDIMVEVLSILAIATKEAKRGRLSESML